MYNLNLFSWWWSREDRTALLLVIGDTVEDVLRTTAMILVEHEVNVEDRVTAAKHYIKDDNHLMCSDVYFEI